MRQKAGQEVFRDILNSVADGKFNDEHYEIVKTRAMYNLTDEEKDSIYERSVMICSKNADRGAFNLNRIKKLPKAKAVAEAENHPRHSVMRGF